MRPAICFISSTLLLYCNISFSQHASSLPGNCLNAGFESGNMDGYQTYYGSIDDFGNLQINTAGIDPDQFEIMTRQSGMNGLDENAWNSCTHNKSLPVVPPGAGRYTLRLGDLDGGSKAARIVLEFEVTPDVSFFLLNYAVILEDPSHEYHEQPRFELYIRDVNENLLDCGTYSVRAAAQIPGFESCNNDLRIRPWTSAGFELQSYLGQTIRIEIIVADCSLGGHGGYAYIDASCKPLELVLDGYCPGAESARYIITDGFEKYLWSTGATTNEITINNPVAGTAYSVTLTSATGCTIVLRDTLPEIQELMLADFNPLSDTTICKGESFWVFPTGDNLPFIYSLDLGYSADSFLLEPVDTTTYSFISRDDYGCKTDTVKTTVSVVNLSFDVVVQEPCGVNGVGELNIIPSSGDSPFTITINSVDYMDTFNFPGLDPGNYQVRLTDANGCISNQIITFVGRPFPEIDTIYITPATCGLDNAKIEIRPVGSIGLHEYSMDNINYTSSHLFNSLKAGSYWVYIQTQYGCKDSVEIFIKQYEEPFIKTITTDSTTCHQANGKVSFVADGGYGDLEYSLTNNTFQTDLSFPNLYAGSYTLYVRDELGCTVLVPFIVHAINIPAIKEINTVLTTCGLNNGSAEILVDNGRPPYEFKLNNIYSGNEGYFQDLSPGYYTLAITDKLGCIIESSFEIKEIIAPRITGFRFIGQECGSTLVAGSMAARYGTKPYNFSFNGGSSFQSDTVSYRIKEGPIHLLIRDSSGCTDDSLIILPDKVSLYIPNVFSPNDDGINDKFALSVSDDAYAVVHTYQIFDRWGSLLYEADNFSVDSDGTWWKGTYGGENRVTPGVYVYFIRIRLEDGRMICRKGDVTAWY